MRAGWSGVWLVLEVGWDALLCSVLSRMWELHILILLKLRETISWGTEGSIFHPTYHTVFSPHHSLSSSFPGWPPAARFNSMILNSFFNFSNIRSRDSVEQIPYVFVIYLPPIISIQPFFLPNAGCPQNIIKMTFDKTKLSLFLPDRENSTFPESHYSL